MIGQAANRELDARSFLDKSRVLGVLSVKGSINGLTLLNNELFVVRGCSKQVDAHNTNNFLSNPRSIKIEGSIYLWSLVASSWNNCLYISDPDLMVVHRYNLSDKVTTQWCVGGKCYGLSLTSTHNILVTMEDPKKIKEYTPNGISVREISLDGSMEYSKHSVQLSSDRLIVSHGWSESPHRVCIIDMSGRSIQAYGWYEGSSSGQWIIMVK